MFIHIVAENMFDIMVRTKTIIMTSIEIGDWLRGGRRAGGEGGIDCGGIGSRCLLLYVIEYYVYFLCLVV